jgi:hypothetical protein
MIGRLVINNLKNVEENGYGITWNTTLAFTWRDWESRRKASVRIAVLVTRFEIRASGTQVTSWCSVAMKRIREWPEWHRLCPWRFPLFASVPATFWPKLWFLCNLQIFLLSSKEEKFVISFHSIPHFSPHPQTAVYNAVWFMLKSPTKDVKE